MAKTVLIPLHDTASGERDIARAKRMAQELKKEKS
jgi:hypothetical protein